MNLLNEDLIYEQKMDKITEQLEELVLNAIITALQKIEKRNLEFIKFSIPSQTDDMSF